jgi:hypothetical protein
LHSSEDGLHGGYGFIFCHRCGGFKVLFYIIEEGEEELL